MRGRVSFFKNVSHPGQRYEEGEFLWKAWEGEVEAVGVFTSVLADIVVQRSIDGDLPFAAEYPKATLGDVLRVVDATRGVTVWFEIDRGLRIIRPVEDLYLLESGSYVEAHEPFTEEWQAGVIEEAIRNPLSEERARSLYSKILARLSPTGQVDEEKLETILSDRRTMLQRDREARGLPGVTE